MISLPSVNEVGSTKLLTAPSDRAQLFKSLHRVQPVYRTEDCISCGAQESGKKRKLQIAIEVQKYLERKIVKERLLASTKL